MEGQSIKILDARGTIELNVDGRLKMKFKRSDYLYAVIPEPAKVKQLESVFESGDFAKVAQEAKPLFSQYSLLGWGDKIAYLEGTSLLELKKPAEALVAFRNGWPLRRKYEDEISRGMIVCMLQTGQQEKVEAYLPKLVRSENKADAALAFNAKGQILTQRGKEKEAVLEYLKTLLLFSSESKSVKPYRDEARTNVVALLKKMGDRRWEKFQKMK